MEYSFPHYLLSKQSVDDRALNRVVLSELKSRLGAGPLRVLDVGAGIGSMLKRLVEWEILPAQVDYTLLDEMPENIAFAREWLQDWARQNGLQVNPLQGDGLRLAGPARTVRVHFVQADVFEYIRSRPARADLLVAHAFLDLLPLPESLPGRFSLVRPGGLAWLTVNFDGLTAFEPELDAALDEQIVRLFHRSMDERVTNGARSGDSRTGRHLFGYLKQQGASILAAGASDWVVYPRDGRYPADEAYFLHFILHFFETSLAGYPELDAELFAAWLARRRDQVEAGELVYIAHQLDYLVGV